MELYEINGKRVQELAGEINLIIMDFFVHNLCEFFAPNTIKCGKLALFNLASIHLLMVITYID